MLESTPTPPRDSPSAEQINERWQQGLALYELWTGIWAEQPELARRAGLRVEELMMSIDEVRARRAKQWSVPEGTART